MSSGRFDCEITSAHGVFSCTVKDIYEILGEWRRSPALISFDTRRRFGCAGRIDIFIDRAHEGFFIDLGKHGETK